MKLHTGEKNGPNIIPREWVRELLEKDLPGASIIETNTYYQGGRYTTADHRETLKVNGWTFCPVDILDAEGAVLLPVRGGKWFSAMSMGKSLTNYDSMVALTHFKGHSKGGFGGSNKNIGIGCADGQVGKKMIHTTPRLHGYVGHQLRGVHGADDRVRQGSHRLLRQAGHLCERAAEYVRLLRLRGTAAEPVVTPNIGICASTDILAVDQACVDLVYALKEEDRHALVERMESRHGLRQLTYMKELAWATTSTCWWTSTTATS